MERAQKRQQRRQNEKQKKGCEQLTFITAAHGSLAAGFRPSCLMLGLLSWASSAAADVPPLWLGIHVTCTSDKLMFDQHTKV